MVVNDPLMPKIGDYVKPKFNRNKFIEIYHKFNPRVDDINERGLVYDSLINKNHQLRAIHNRGNDLCSCHVDEELLGWIVPIQCLKRVKI